MKKVVIEKAGGFDQLKIQDFPQLKAKDSEIVVTVKAIGVNYADIVVRWGLYKSARQFIGWPITPGFEFAGVVKEIGRSCRGFKKGDKVFGVTFFNGYAEEVAVAQHQLFAIPKGWTFAEAASFPAVFLTAYHGLFQLIRIRPQSSILIHSAAGGVGSALLQLSRAYGFYAIGIVGSSSKKEVAKKNGADLVFIKSEAWAELLKEKIPAGIDVIFDANGGKSLKISQHILAPSGKLVSYGAHTLLSKTSDKLNFIKLIKGWLDTPRFNPLNMTNMSLVTFNLSFLFDKKEILEEAMFDLLKLVKAKKIYPLGVTEIPFEKVALAHELLQSGKTTGKLVLITK